ncbi:MAG: hypothetical protein JJD97_15340 [Gemmatimonadaceae bacterium]|nr:hypothetical protein [Gemmatimonadaceae bacterium]
MIDGPVSLAHALTARVGARLNTRASFAPTRFVWSRGLALLCDRNGGFDFVRKQRGSGRAALRFDPAAYEGMRDGDLVWVRLTALPQFIAEVLPSIRARIALVTGDEDVAVPSQVEGASEILANEHILCWFTQNLDGTQTSDKLFPIPIGINFHTISHGRRWGHLQATPRRQEAELVAMRAAMLPNAMRRVRVHADFHFNKHANQRLGDSRDEVHAMLAANPCVDFQRKKVSRMALWREKTKYAFVVSPHGHGLDCHRTWESLALGNIVIVKRSSLDPLYEGLPVVIVQDWQDITAENLGRWHLEYRRACSAGELEQRLTNHYWITRMHRLLAERMQPSISTSSPAVRPLP